MIDGRGLCHIHGEKKRYCREPGCNNLIQNQFKCINHGAKQIKCKFDGCTKQAVKDGHCKRHGGGGRKCTIPGCEKKKHSRKMCKKHIRTMMAADTMPMMSDAGGVKSASFPTAMETAEETTVSDAGGNKSIEGQTTTMICIFVGDDKGGGEERGSNEEGDAVLAEEGWKEGSWAPSLSALNRARLLYGGMSTLLNTRNFWQELPAVRRQFSRGSRTGKFSSTVLLMETQLKKG